jgi:hypothetical protein
VKGIEPSSSAWKAVALPLSYTRGRQLGGGIATWEKLPVQVRLHHDAAVSERLPHGLRRQRAPAVGLPVDAPRHKKMPRAASPAAAARSCSSLIVSSTYCRSADVKACGPLAGAARRLACRRLARSSSCCRMFASGIWGFPCRVRVARRRRGGWRSLGNARENLCNTRNMKAAPERATVFQIILSFQDACVGSPSRSSRPQDPPSLYGASADKSGFRPAFVASQLRRGSLRHAWACRAEACGAGEGWWGR